MTDKLNELAKRCERATGPDRTIDGLIFAHLNADKRIIIGNLPGPFPQDPEYGTPLNIIGMAETDGPGLAQYLGAPAYTASLDAAMTLVPEGWRFRVENSSAHVGETHALEGREVITQTTALALCAAALRARAASGIETEGHDRETGHGAKHESPTAAGGDAHPFPEQSPND